MNYRRLKAGAIVAPGKVVTLFLGTGDQRREIEWFRTEEDWTVPEMTNGYWYGVES